LTIALCRRFSQTPCCFRVPERAAQILAANDQRENARAVLQHSADMYLKLGHNDTASAAAGLIRQFGLE
jgi:hypothetical protein